MTTLCWSCVFGLSISVRCHSWCSPGCSTSRPRPGKSSSSSCSSQQPLNFHPDHLKPRLAERCPAGMDHWGAAAAADDDEGEEGEQEAAAAAAGPLQPRKEPGGLTETVRRRCEEEWGFPSGLNHSAGCSVLWHHWEKSTGKSLAKEKN